MTKCNVPFSTDGAFTDVQVTPDTNTNPITSKKLDQTTADFPQAQGQRSWQRQTVLCVSFILYIIFKALLPEGFTGIQCWFSALPLMSRDFSVLLWIPCNRVLRNINFNCWTKWWTSPNPCLCLSYQVMTPHWLSINLFTSGMFLKGFWVIPKCSQPFVDPVQMCCRHRTTIKLICWTINITILY